MKIALFHFSPVWCDVESNLIRIIETLRQQSFVNVDLVALPEACLTGFAIGSEMKPLKNLDSELHALAVWAKETSTSLLLGAFVEEGGTTNNSMVLISGRSGKVSVVYRKINLFSFANEQEMCVPGSDLGFLEVNKVKMGLAICFDLRAVELFSEYRKSRADLVIVIANWPAVRQDHFTTLLKARALDMQFAVIGLNRSGSDPIAGNYVGEPLGFYPDGTAIEFVKNDQFSYVEVGSAEITSRKLELMRGFYD
jgi:predicted amidohydrolase